MDRHIALLQDPDTEIRVTVETDYDNSKYLHFRLVRKCEFYNVSIPARMSRKTRTMRPAHERTYSGPQTLDRVYIDA